LPKFGVKKLQMVITFDINFGLRRFKNGISSNMDNEVCGQFLKGIQNPKLFQNFIIYYLFF